MRTKRPIDWGEMASTAFGWAFILFWICAIGLFVADGCLHPKKPLTERERAEERAESSFVDGWNALVGGASLSLDKDHTAELDSAEQTSSGRWDRKGDRAHVVVDGAAGSLDRTYRIVEGNGVTLLVPAEGEQTVEKSFYTVPEPEPEPDDRY